MRILKCTLNAYLFSLFKYRTPLDYDAHGVRGLCNYVTARRTVGFAGGGVGGLVVVLQQPPTEMLVS